VSISSVEEVLEDVLAGHPIVLIDDDDREHEGDIMIAAEKVSTETINLMLQHGKGLICISLTEERLLELGIPMQVTENSSLFGTNFAVSFDCWEVSDYAITARGRAETIRRAACASYSADDFCMPGNVVPVVAVPGGVLKRRGQTEGSVDLSRLAGLSPAGVICEIMDEQGQMLRGQRLLDYCAKHGFKMTSVDAIVKYRLKREVSVRRVVECNLSSAHSVGRSEPLKKLLADSMGDEHEFRVIVYLDDIDDKEHLVLIMGEPKEAALTRIHSQCLTGDIFESSRCDCGQQLDKALEAIVLEGEGILVYLQQEGRGIGLGNKLKAYELQDAGMDTVDANIHLGFEADERDYRVGAQILADLGISSVRLMTNNPGKLESLPELGVVVVERVPLSAVVDKHNKHYLATKRDRMGHLLPE